MYSMINSLKESRVELLFFVEIMHFDWLRLIISVTRKKLPNAYKSCPKLISLENDRFLSPLQKLPKNVGDLGK